MYKNKYIINNQMFRNNLVFFKPKTQILNIKDKSEIKDREKNTYYNKIIHNINQNSTEDSKLNKRKIIPTNSDNFNNNNKNILQNDLY